MPIKNQTKDLKNANILPLIGGIVLAAFLLLSMFYGSVYMSWLLPSALIISLVLFIKFIGERP
jgi:hypothetical protein